MLRLPSLDSGTRWTGDIWSKTYLPLIIYIPSLADPGAAQEKYVVVQYVTCHPLLDYSVHNTAYITVGCQDKFLVSNIQPVIHCHRTE